MLRALGEEVIALREEFPESIKDVDLFEQLRGRHDILASTNTSQLTRKHEARALKQCGITALYFGPFYQKMKLWDQAVWLIKRWPLINGFARGVTKVTCAEIKQNGKALVLSL